MNFRIFALFAVVILASLPFGSSSPVSDLISTNDDPQPPWAGADGKFKKKMQVPLDFNIHLFYFIQHFIGKCNSGLCDTYCKELRYKKGQCKGPKICHCMASR